MKSHSITATVLVILMFFLGACAAANDYKVTREPIDTVSQWPEGKQKQVDVLEVVKKSGDSTEYLESSPGKIRDGAVFGPERLDTRVSISKSNIKTSSYREDDKTMTVETTDGKSYTLQSPIITDDLVEGTASQIAISIPFSEIDFLWIKQIKTEGHYKLKNTLKHYGPFWLLAALYAIFVL